jgi:hypothetical protein
VTDNAHTTEEDRALPIYCSSDNGRQKSVQYANIQWGGPATVDRVVKIIDVAGIYIQANGIAVKDKGKVVLVLN